MPSDSPHTVTPTAGVRAPDVNVPEQGGGGAGERKGVGLDSRPRTWKLFTLQTRWVKRFFYSLRVDRERISRRSASGSKSQTERDGKTDIRKNGMMMGNEKTVVCCLVSSNHE